MGLKMDQTARLGILIFIPYGLYLMTHALEHDKIDYGTILLKLSTLVLLFTFWATYNKTNMVIVYGILFLIIVDVICGYKKVF